MTDRLDELVVKLKDSSKDVVKASIVEAIGQIQDPRAVKPLIEALNDEEMLVRWNAIKGLARFGEDAVAPLLRAMDTADRFKRRNVVQALGELGGDEVVDRLIRMLMFDESDQMVQVEVIRALDRIRDARSVDPLITVLKMDNWEMRWRTIHALEHLGDPRAIEPLLEVMNDGDKDIQWAAYMAIEGIKSARDRVPADAAATASETCWTYLCWAWCAGMRPCAAGGAIRMPHLEHLSLRPVMIVRAHAQAWFWKPLEKAVVPQRFFSCPARAQTRPWTRPDGVPACCGTGFRFTPGAAVCGEIHFAIFLIRSRLWTAHKTSLPFASTSSAWTAGWTTCSAPCRMPEFAQTPHSARDPDSRDTCSPQVFRFIPRAPRAEHSPYLKHRTRCTTAPERRPWSGKKRSWIACPTRRTARSVFLCTLSTCCKTGMCAKLRRAW